MIQTYNRQKPENDYLSDEEIEPIIGKIVNEVTMNIGEEYKSFLIEKYFGSIENLIAFITEDVYVDLISDAINRNVGKIKKEVQRKTIENITKKQN